jgi:archaeal flagellin N-terminal-like domain
MANFKKNDEAVSAVIGVILMVAITVILAAVIAAFVFQLGGSTPKNKTVVVDVNRVGTDSLTVKTMSGEDIVLLCGADTNSNGVVDPAEYTYTATCNNPDGSVVTLNVDTSSSTGVANAIGTTVKFTCGSSDDIESGADITIIAHFTDGSQTAVWSGPLA